MASELPASGTTDVSRTTAWLLVAATLLLLLLPPLLSPSRGAWHGLAAAGTELAAADGAGELNRALQRVMDNFERTLEDGSAVLEHALPPIQWLLSGWGGAGNERTYVGYGWLFFRPGFDYLTGPAFLDPAVMERRRRGAASWEQTPAPDPKPAILAFHRQLAARGIELLIVPAPSKIMVHPDGLAPSYAGRAAGEPPLHNASFAALHAALEGAGVHVFDPTGPLEDLRRSRGVDAYLRTDSHWSPAAVDAVAGWVAEHIRRLDLPFSGSEVRWHRTAVDHTGEGDLARTLRLPEWSRLFPPQTVRLEHVLDGTGAPLRTDPRAEILVLGDSFTNVFAVPSGDVAWGRGAGLAEQLAFHLGRPVDRVAVNRDGASGSRRRLADLLAADPDRLGQTRIVVWEFAVRELAVGDWQIVELPR